MTVTDHPVFSPPAVLEVIPQHQAERVMQAMVETLRALETQIELVTNEVEALEQRMEVEGAAPAAIEEATARMDSVIDQLRTEATADADRVIAAAHAEREEVDAAVAVAELPVVSSPPPQPPPPAAPPAPGPAPTTGLAGVTFLTPSSSHVEEHFELGGERNAEERQAFARTIGLLHVVLWSVLIAAVLIVGLAWFA